MPGEMVVWVRAEPLGPVEQEWCPHCLLPSAVAVPFAIMMDHALTGLVRVVHCVDCGCEWTG